MFDYLHVEFENFHSKFVKLEDYYTNLEKEMVLAKKEITRWN